MTCSLVTDSPWWCTYHAGIEVHLGNNDGNGNAITWASDWPELWRRCDAGDPALYAKPGGPGTYGHRDLYLRRPTIAPGNEEIAAQAHLVEYLRRDAEEGDPQARRLLPLAIEILETLEANHAARQGLIQGAHRRGEIPRAR